MKKRCKKKGVFGSGRGTPPWSGTRGPPEGGPKGSRMVDSEGFGPWL